MKYKFHRTRSPWPDGIVIEEGRYEGLFFYFTKCFVKELKNADELWLDYDFVILRKPTKFADMFDPKSEEAKDFMADVLADILKGQLPEVKAVPKQFVDQEGEKKWAGFAYEYKETVDESSKV